MKGLKETVIKEGFCIGCGICAAVKGSPYKITFNKYGILQAQKTMEIEDTEIYSKVCPMTSERDEDNLAEERFNCESNYYHEDIGLYSSLHVGYVKNNNDRIESSSGGMCTWFLEQLFEQGQIDGVIHVKESSSSEKMFEYNVSYNLQDIKQGRKSRYYPIELSDTLNKIRNDGKRYALVGIPCYIKAVRLLVENSPEFNNIKFFVGIICGQLKSKNFSYLFSSGLGIKPRHLAGIDYRLKRKGELAQNYGVKLFYKKDGQVKEIETKAANQFYGSNWGMGMFKYKACDACDDVFNETADVVFGDAWIKPYYEDWKGTNLIIIRNKELYDSFQPSDKIFFKNLPAEEIIKTQAGSVRHRRKYLAYRLYLLKRMNKWVPTKRFSPLKKLDRKNRNIQKVRLVISTMSRLLKQNNSFNFQIVLFKIIMKPIFLYYFYLNRGMVVFIPKIIRNLKLFRHENDYNKPAVKQ